MVGPTTRAPPLNQTPPTSFLLTFMLTSKHLEDALAPSPPYSHEGIHASDAGHPQDHVGCDARDVLHPRECLTHDRAGDELSHRLNRSTRLIGWSVRCLVRWLVCFFLVS